MPRHVSWKETADEIINGGWGETKNSVKDLVKDATDSRLTVILLRDIAESLRVLRCHNFTDIPRRLDRIRVAAEGMRRERKTKGTRKTP